MSDQERKELSERLQIALKKSFFKMLELKRKLGQDVVTCDSKGNTIIISAEEALRMAKDSDDKNV